MQTESNKLGQTLAVALIASIIGAVVWALLIILFRYEAGVLAWGIGALSGYAVGFVAKGRISGIHQIISVVSALLGITAGKYAGFSYQLNGRKIAGIFDSEMLTVFQKNLSISFGGFDIIFVILAVVTAWRIPLQFKHVEENRDEIHQHINEQDEVTRETNKNEKNLSNKKRFIVLFILSTSLSIITIPMCKL